MKSLNATWGHTAMTGERSGRSGEVPTSVGAPPGRPSRDSVYAQGMPAISFIFAGGYDVQLPCTAEDVNALLADWTNHKTEGRRYVLRLNQDGKVAGVFCPSDAVAVRVDYDFDSGTPPPDRTR